MGCETIYERAANVETLGEAAQKHQSRKFVEWIVGLTDHNQLGDSSLVPAANDERLCRIVEAAKAKEVRPALIVVCGDV